MSIRLIDQYPNRVDPTSNDYPHGEPRNRTAPGATDGTPYEEAWYKDQEGFFQGLIEAAGITPSGSPDTVPNSDYLASLVQVASGVTEIDVGGSSDVTLDYNQSRISALRLTGTLAADIDVIVPDTERIYLILNETSGSFDITISTSGGTGVVVNNSVDQVRSDGTNVVRALPVEVKNNFTATSAPTVNDDTDSGYSVGSNWVNLSTDTAFKCVDSTAGAAVWVSTTGGESTEVGGYVAVQTDLAGSNKPDSSRYIELTAGLTGSGQYNEGKLINETVSGSQPTLTATADIDDPDSPLDGQTVNLINTEERYLQPGESAGTTAQDHFQGHYHFLGTRADPDFYDGEKAAGAGTNEMPSGNAPDRDTPFATTPVADESNNGTPRISDHTDVKNIQTTYFMRIK